MEKWKNENKAEEQKTISEKFKIIDREMSKR
jgi:hypothetical protein